MRGWDLPSAAAIVDPSRLRLCRWLRNPAPTEIKFVYGIRFPPFDENIAFPSPLNSHKKCQPRFSSQSSFFCAINFPDVYVFTFGPRSCAISFPPVWEISSLWSVWWCTGWKHFKIMPSFLPRLFFINISPSEDIPHVQKEEKLVQKWSLKNKNRFLIWWYFALIFFPRLSRGQTRYSAFSSSSSGLLLRKITCKLWSRILNESVTRNNGPSRVKQIGKQPCAGLAAEGSVTAVVIYHDDHLTITTPQGSTYCCRTCQRLQGASYCYKAEGDFHSQGE